jgi:hypothetical protein
MEEFGLGINLNKSLISENGSFEFAKRLVYKSQLVSIVSFKELDASMVSLDALLLMIERFKGNDFKLSTVMKLLGFRNKSLSQISNKLSNMSLRMKLLII